MVIILLSVVIKHPNVSFQDRNTMTICHDNSFDLGDPILKSNKIKAKEGYEDNRQGIHWDFLLKGTSNLV